MERILARSMHLTTLHLIGINGSSSVTNHWLKTPILQRGRTASGRASSFFVKLPIPLFVKELRWTDSSTDERIPARQHCAAS